MKQIITKNIFLFVLLAGMVLPAFAQTTPLKVKIVNEDINKKDNSVTVNLEFILDDVAVHTNDMVIYTPVIVSADNRADRVQLPPVILTGNKRNKILNRQQRLYGQMSFEAEPLTILKKNNDAQQSIEYSATVAYSNWMQGATLLLESAVSGCADCYEQNDDLLVASNLMTVKELPTFSITYIAPEVEPVKARSDSHTATFNFVVGRYELLRDFKNNASEFNKVDRIVSEVVGNKDINITEFTVSGYASPEGGFESNRSLSANRANSFATYLNQHHGVKESQLRVNGFGEDWAGLRKAIASSMLADKDEVLHIIDNVSNPDARDAALKKLSNGQTYQSLLNNYYPALRRTDYTIAYNVRAFDVEEAREIIKTNPKLLSLNEMYLVAQSYDATSKEFKEVFDIAARMYPDSEIAIINSAAADIENNAIDHAISQMEKMGDNPRAWNNLGVAYVLKGDLQKALELFEKAAATNDGDAKRNLEGLKKYMDNE